MLCDENGNPLEFLDILSVASTIVWFKSIVETEQRSANMSKDIDFLKSGLLTLENKIDRMLEILIEK